MSLETDTVIDRIMGRASARSQYADAEDISDGITFEIDDVTSFTVYLKVAAATNIQIELSPNGTEWFEPGKAGNTPAESPIKFDGAGTEVVHFSYDADALRLTASDSTATTVNLKEVV